MEKLDCFYRNRRAAETFKRGYLTRLFLQYFEARYPFGI